MTLHLLSNVSGLHRALPAIDANDEILLIDNIETLYAATQAACPGIPCYALTDTKARKKDPQTANGIPSEVDYRDFVALTIRHPHCLSW